MKMFSCQDPGQITEAEGEWWNLPSKQAWRIFDREKKGMDAVDPTLVLEFPRSMHLLDAN